MRLRNVDAEMDAIHTCKCKERCGPACECSNGCGPQMWIQTRVRLRSADARYTPLRGEGSVATKKLPHMAQVAASPGVPGDACPYARVRPVVCIVWQAANCVAGCASARAFTVAFTGNGIPAAVRVHILFRSTRSWQAALAFSRDGWISADAAKPRPANPGPPPSPGCVSSAKGIGYAWAPRQAFMGAFERGGWVAGRGPPSVPLARGLGCACKIS